MRSDESLQRRVAMATDVSVVSRYIYWVGMHNNGVHLSLFYPKMRRKFSSGYMEILAEAGTVEEFIVRYAQNALDLAYWISVEKMDPP